MQQRAIADQKIEHRRHFEQLTKPHEPIEHTLQPGLHLGDKQETYFYETLDGVGRQRKYCMIMCIISPESQFKATLSSTTKTRSVTMFKKLTLLMLLK